MCIIISAQYWFFPVDIYVYDYFLIRAELSFRCDHVGIKMHFLWLSFEVLCKSQLNFVICIAQEMMTSSNLVRVQQTTIFCTYHHSPVRQDVEIYFALLKCICCVSSCLPFFLFASFCQTTRNTLFLHPWTIAQGRKHEKQSSDFLIRTTPHTTTVLYFPVVHFAAAIRAFICARFFASVWLGSTP